MTRADLLGGRYQLGEVIGRGGMAEVRHGNDVRLGRDVAVKVLRADLATDPAFITRFRREAQSAASLDASTIVSVYDTGEDASGVPWIVMEYVDGRTLRDILTTEGRLLPQRALEVTADICSALEVAHAAGMVHRDIKPANVMLTSRGEVKVMDFGIARAAAGHESTMTQTQSVIGTAAYLSPEQARGEHVDARSDIYSAGCLLYELVTGSPPFVGESAVAVAYQHVREDPVAPSEFDPSLSPETAAALDAVILKAMAKNPANRYQSADEMREDLLRAVAGRPVLATPVMDRPDDTPWVEQAETRARRRRKGTVVYVVSGVIAAAVAVALGLFVHAVLGTPNGLIKPPNVVGMTQTAAINQLTAFGLTADQPSSSFNTTVPAGHVISQTPIPDFYIKKGGTVHLVVSEGAEMTTVPNVIGLSLTDAEAALTAAKLKFNPYPNDVNAPAGQVLRIGPAPGTVLPVAKGTVVNVVVASGNVPVPGVVGLLQDQAISQLAALDFGVGVRMQPSTTKPPGTVLAEYPANGVAARGSSVVIDVAFNPATVSPSPGTTPSPGASPGTTPAASGTPSPSPTP